MLYKISFLQNIQQDMSQLDISRAVDKLQSFYSCPTTWELDLILNPINNSVGFSCSKETTNWSIHNSKQYVEIYTENTQYKDLLIVDNDVTVMFE